MAKTIERNHTENAMPEALEDMPEVVLVPKEPKVKKEKVAKPKRVKKEGPDIEALSLPEVPPNVPQQIRTSLNRSGVDFSRLKTSPNFTYDLSRIKEHSADDEISPEQSAQILKDFEDSIVKALEPLGWTLKVVASGSNSKIKADDDSLVIRNDVVRIRKVVSRPKKAKATVPAETQPVAEEEELVANPEG